MGQHAPTCAGSPQHSWIWENARASLPPALDWPRDAPRPRCWNITITGESRDTWPGWVAPLAWIGVGLWLLVAVGVLLFRLSLLRELHAENEWIFEHGVAHHAAFEAWLAREGLPPSGSKPVSSQALFGTQAAGGYFILHLPVSAIAGATAEHPPLKKLKRIRRKLRRHAARRAP